MAIEDSAVLAACLKLDKEIPARLEQYEKLRHKRTANIQSGSRRNAKLFHLSGWKAWIRNQAVGVAQTRMMDSLYSYNALEALNSQP